MTFTQLVLDNWFGAVIVVCFGLVPLINAIGYWVAHAYRAHQKKGKPAA